MVMRQPRYTAEEHARRGSEMYEMVIRPKVEAGNLGKIVSFDIETGEYELGDTTLEAAQQLLERLPDAEIWSERIGYPSVYRFGGLRFATV